MLDCQQELFQINYDDVTHDNSNNTNSTFSEIKNNPQIMFESVLLAAVLCLAVCMLTGLSYMIKQAHLLCFCDVVSYTRWSATTVLNNSLDCRFKLIIPHYSLACQLINGIQ